MSVFFLKVEAQEIEKYVIVIFALREVSLGLPMSFVLSGFLREVGSKSIFLLFPSLVHSSGANSCWIWQHSFPKDS